MINLLNFIWLFSCFPHEIFFCFVEPLTEYTTLCDIVQNDLISTLFYDRVLLFYDPLGSQWLCRSVQFSPHLILFYCTLAALLLGNSGGWKRQEKLYPFFPRESPDSRAEYKEKPVPTVVLNFHHSKCSTLTFTVGMSWDWGLFDIFCHDQLRGLSACWCACDRAPHCCSDVSSLCPCPMTVTPSLLVLSWGNGMSGLPLLSFLHLPNPLPFGLQPHHPPTVIQGEVLSRPADLFTATVW